MKNDKKSIERPLLLAMRYLSYRPRSIYEIEEYIKKKGFDKNIVRKTIEILLEKNYLKKQNYIIEKSLNYLLDTEMPHNNWLPSMKIKTD